MAASWAGCGLHLALLLLLPEQCYKQQRSAITLGLRVLYLLGTARSYGQCHVGRAATHEVLGTAQESLFSAGVWRSGLVGLLWYAGAFPLLFWQHCLVQAVFLLAYWSSLAPAVVRSLLCS
ncbi:hypothetical protein OEZ86_010066 [Tetradesmus obliquus]|uniref:Uncharacterized protein n=1 Tax=Tetradesmus obliquus TaxID=3088 RepID=A0ABY8UP47_TETOB|nr:hypothetical protein OEZ85_001501 [Tetradesmus obliquus]WIA43625.1 hypothetical protein OEZ86_010066 [Tetradesmus obliquus]